MKYLDDKPDNQFFPPKINLFKIAELFDQLNQADEFKIEDQKTFRLVVDHQFNLTKKFVLIQLAIFVSFFVCPMVYWVLQDPGQREYISW